MSIRHLDRLLAPKSVAVVGASDRVGSVGATVWRNLRAGHFTGPVWAVNPKHDCLDGEPVVAHSSALPHAPDLAVLCTPAATVPGLIDELGRLTTGPWRPRMRGCGPERTATGTMSSAPIFFFRGHTRTHRDSSRSWHPAVVHARFANEG